MHIQANTCIAIECMYILHELDFTLYIATIVNLN